VLVFGYFGAAGVLAALLREQKVRSLPARRRRASRSSSWRQVMIHDVSVAPFDAAAILIVLAGTLGDLIRRFLHLPRSPDGNGGGRVVDRGSR
jgi:hypothetical protein